MPEATLEAVDDHGSVPVSDLRQGYDEAHRVLRDLAAVGVSYDDVVRVLEEEGVAKFEAGRDELSRALALRSPCAPTPRGWRGWRGSGATAPPDPRSFPHPLGTEEMDEAPAVPPRSGPPSLAHVE